MWSVWLNHLIIDATCFKIWNFSCIGNLYTNKKTTFYNSSTVKTGISDHHSLICTVLPSILCEGPAKFVLRRSYNNYNKEEFEKVSWSNFEEFFDTFLATLNEYVPLKNKKVRYNHEIFMSNTKYIQQEKIF